MRSWIPFTLALGIGLFGCETSTTTPGASGTPSAAAAAEDIGEVIAKVDGMAIGSKDFEKAAARTTPEDGDSLSDDERRDVLDRLIADKVLYKEALRLGLDQDPKVQKVMVNTLLRQEVYAQVRNSDFGEEMLKAYYDEHPEEFVVPEKVQIKRILVRINDERPKDQALAEAQRLRGLVAGNPKDEFKDVASKHSEDPYRRRGGDVGFVSSEGKPGLDEAIVTKAFEMSVGEVSEPFETDDGYNIIYVANKRERVERTFQQMKGSVLRKVKNEKLKELYQGYVDQLKQSSSIEIDEAKLAAVEVKPAIQAPAPSMGVNPMVSRRGMPSPDGEEGEELDEMMDEGMEEAGDE
jgi:peptidyl-prolyl cis-trans isomerase C